jgi:hypothetical protein
MEEAEDEFGRNYYVVDSQGRYHFSPSWQKTVDKGWDIDKAGVAKDLAVITIASWTGAGLVVKGFEDIAKAIGGAVLTAFEAFPNKKKH